MSFVLDRLHRLYGEIRERKFAVVDIEARQWVNPYAVGFYDGDTYMNIIDYRKDNNECIRQALLHMLQPKYAGYWIYAHNGGNYDFLFFLRELSKPLYSNYRVDITPIQSTVIRIDVAEIDGKAPPEADGRQPAKKNRHWSFLDSARLMPVRLNQIGETFGIGKKVDIGMSYDDLAKPQNRELMSKYLKQDCLLLYEALTKMQTMVNGLGGQIGVTLPSTALDIFRRRYLKTDVYTNRHWPNCKDAQDEDTTRDGHHPDAGDFGTGDRSRSRGRIRAKGRHVHVQDDPLHGPVPASGVLPEARGTGATGSRVRGGVERDDGRAHRGHANDARGRTREKGTRKHELPASCQGCAHDFIRAAYFGGRTEIFRMMFQSSGPHDLARMYDINSHYPHCMLDPMPVGVATFIDGGQSEDFVYQNANTRVGMVDCTVNIPTDCYLPPLPMKRNGKLIFPVGRFRGTWDTAELCLLRSVGGTIEEIHGSCWFESAPIFQRFVMELYKLRDKKSKAYSEGMSYVAKILMNSLYGKFAMQESRMKIVMRPNSPVGLYAIDLQSDIWAEEVNMKPNYVVPQLSVHVTALARARLWLSLMDVVQRGGKIYYCDTDSIVCSGVDVPTGDKLGDLKLEDGTIRRAEFVLPKLYLIESDEVNKKKKREQHLKVKAKGMGPGIRLSAAGEDELGGQLSEQEFVDLIKKGTPILRHRLTKLREGLNGYAKQSLTFPRIVASPKSIKSHYEKRVVLDDYNTSPIVVYN